MVPEVFHHRAGREGGVSVENLIEFSLDGEIIDSVFSASVPAVGDMVISTLDNQDLCIRVVRREWVIDRDQRRQGTELNVVLVCERDGEDG